MGDEFNIIGIALMMPPTPDCNIIFKPFELPKEATDDLKLENDTDNVLIEDAVILD